jgi:predicted O-linked N-acetylglucosamine transferase (SPINDLY family)
VTSGLLTLPEPNLDAVFNASVTLHQAGRLEQACNGYRRILAAVPHHPESTGYLGMALAQAERHREAAAFLRRASGLAPGDAAVHSNLGNALSSLDRPAEARRSYRRAIALAPAFCPPLSSAAMLEPRTEGRVIGAARSAACEPAYAPALIALVSVNDGLGRIDLAERWSRRARAMLPQAASILLVSADHALAAGDAAASARIARRSLAVSGQDAATMFRLGVADERQGLLDDAGRHYRKGLVLDPAFVAAGIALGSLELGFGYPAMAERLYRRAATAEAEGNRVFALSFLEHEDPQAIVRANHDWAARQGGAAPGRATPRRRRPERLRVGYVSPEFVKHGFLLCFLPALTRHDRSRHEIFAYSQATAFDRWSAEIRRHADHWRSLGYLSIDEQAAVIRDDRIDVLVNLTGYLAHQRSLFLERSAPVQIAYCNHVGPTGIAAIDARITDAWLEPEGASFLDADERLIRLGSGYVSYGPPEAPAVDALPALRNGHVTFGVFNNVAKLSAPALAAWARILDRVPRSRLLIKGYGLSAERARDRVSGMLRRHGIEAARVEMIGRVGDDLANLATVARADVALDPFPFNGGMSTLDALWMGVPVVSLSGPSLVHRIGLTHLSRAGLADLVATGVEAYVERAVALATDLDALATLRRGMRDRLQRSVLFDAERHTRELESVYARLIEERG